MIIPIYFRSANNLWKQIYSNQNTKTQAGTSNVTEEVILINQLFGVA